MSTATEPDPAVALLPSQRTNCEVRAPDDRAHVPPSRLDDFSTLVRDCIGPTGRAGGSVVFGVAHPGGPS